MMHGLRNLRRLSMMLAIGGGMLAAAASSTQAGTLDEVKQRGHLLCGVSEGLIGFSVLDESKTWRGFDADFCRAVAAAIFTDPDKVGYVSLSAGERFDALTSGKIDLLSRNTTWTLSRDVELGLEFVGVSYYDGQGFMTRSENGLSSALQLGGKKICVLGSTTSANNAKAFFEGHNINVELAEYDQREDALKAYEARECDVYSADRSALASQRTKLKDQNEHMLLPEVISKEPLGPVVRQDDPAWSELVRWVLFLLINAEEAGWTSSDVAAKPDEAPISIPEAVSQKMGLEKDWPRAVIGSVGNYDEIFENNIGAETPLRISRGVNALWAKGGILYAPPMQ